MGFRLAGVETRGVSARSEALEALNVALATENTGIILVTEKARVFIKEEIDELTYRNQMPLVLVIPSRGQTGKRRSVGEFLKEAIGVTV